MYKSIVVPLDGSKLAESALPHALGLAKQFGAEVVLVRVIKHTKGYKREVDYTNTATAPSGQSVISEPVSKKEKEVEEYLGAIAKKMQDEGIRVQTTVRLGKPDQAIAFYADHSPCDLIVMASHARRGLGRSIRGSVADGVFRTTTKPILMVRQKA